MVDKTPEYDYEDRNFLSPSNKRAAQAKGWEWDEDWTDYRDEYGFLVHGIFHQRPPNAPLDPTALK